MEDIFGGSCLSPLLSASATPLPTLDPSDLSELGSFGWSDDWMLSPPDTDPKWDLSSEGQSALSSPSSLGDDSGYGDIFSHSTSTSFSGSPIENVDEFDFFDRDHATSTVSTATGMDLIIPGVESAQPTDLPPQKPKRRPTVSTRTAMKAVSSRNNNPAVVEPASISLFSEDKSSKDDLCGVSTSFDCFSDAAKEINPIKPTAKIVQKVSKPRPMPTTRKAQVVRAAANASLPISTETPHALPYMRKPVLVRKRMRECTMVCWLFRTLLTAEYRALPLNGIFEVFEDTFHNPSTAHGRHWRQSIRHCLMSSAVFVRVLTPNPRKDFLVMNEAGSWWTVHPDTEALCARDVFAMGAGHRCPPQQGMPYRLRLTRTEDTRQLYEKRGSAFLGERIYRTPPPLAARRIPPRPMYSRQNGSAMCAFSPNSGDHLVIDHEEEVC